MSWQPQECLDIDAAIHAYTSAAHATADVDYRRGKLEIGFDADVVVLDRDPASCPPDELTSVSVLATFMAGQQRYAL